MLDEYTEVLGRPKFRFSKEKIDAVIKFIAVYHFVKLEFCEMLYGWPIPATP